MENACCGINVKDFGAKGDAKKVSDGKIENKSDILNFKSDNFLKIGNIVNIEGAGKGGSMLSAEIKNVASLREVSINKQSLAKVDPANVTWGTNDSYAIQTAIDDVVKSGGAGIICVTPGTLYTVPEPFCSWECNAVLHG